MIKTGWTKTLIAIVGIMWIATLSWGSTLYEWNFSSQADETRLCDVFSTAREPSVQFPDTMVATNLSVSNCNLIVNQAGGSPSIADNNSFVDIANLSTGTYWLIANASGWSAATSGGVMDLWFSRGATSGDNLAGLRLNFISSAELSVQFIHSTGIAIVHNFSANNSTAVIFALQLNIETGKCNLFYKYGANDWVSYDERNEIASADVTHIRFDASGFAAGNEIQLKAIRLQDHPPWEEEKLTFSLSMNCYPYTGDYSDRIDYSDRPLDWDPRLESTNAAGLKMQRMEEAGIDVCPQVVFYANGLPPVGGDTTTGLGSFSRSLNAAMDKEVRVVPEICAIRRANTYGTSDLADFFREMVEDYGDHPRWLRYNGKLVVFLWQPFDDLYGSPVNYGPTQLAQAWTQLGSELRDQLYVVNETYYMVLCSDEYVVQHWNEDDYVQDMLDVVDNMFWWYSWRNGTSEEFRSQLLADTLRALIGGPIAVGIRPGYYRKNIGMINPHHVTAKFRELWGADVNSNISPDWVYLYSFDDYSENGQIEPTRLNRGAYSSLAHTMISAWKDSADSLPAEAWVGLPLCVMRGQELQAEVIQLNTASAYSQVTLALEDSNGQELYRSAPVTGQQGYGSVDIFHFTVPTTNAVFDGQQALVPVIYTAEGSTTITNRGLSPIRLTRHHPMNPLYQFCRLDRLSEPSSLQFSYTSVPADGQTNVVQGNFQITAGPTNLLKRVELRDLNDYAVPFSGGNFPAISGDTNEVFYMPLDTPTNSLNGTFEFSTHRLLDASAMTYLFIEYENGATWSSPPQWIDFTNNITSATVFSDSSTDDTESVWTTYSCEEQSVSDASVADWDFSAYDSGQTYNGSPYIPDSGLYGFPLYLGYGPNTRMYVGTSSNYPVFNSGAFNFNSNGDDEQVLRLADFTLPPGALSVEFELYPQDITHEQYLLWHRRAGITVSLETGGQIKISRGESTNEISLTSTQPISAQQWHTVRVGDSGSQLYMYIDGALDSTCSHDPLVLPESVGTWSDLVLVGGSTDSAKSYHGKMRRLQIENQSSSAPLPACPFVELFNSAALDSTCWKLSEPTGSSLSITNQMLLLEDYTSAWGAGAGIETWLNYAATGQPVQVSARIISDYSGSSCGTLVRIGLSENAYLTYWFNDTQQRVTLVINNQELWNSQIWVHGNLLAAGDYLGFEFSSAGWEVLKSSDGENWSLLKTGANESQGSFSPEQSFDIREPLTVDVINAQGGEEGSWILLDDFWGH